MRKKSRSDQKNPDKEKKNLSGPPFKIRMGLPQMDTLWNDFTARFKVEKLTSNEAMLYKKWGKALNLLSGNPLYPSLNSHEISTLTQKYGKKIFESYLENRTPGATRMFWTYGPGRAEITILALEPHPEPGKYGSLKLDSEP